MNVYEVIYSIRKPAPAPSTPGQVAIANTYVREAVHASVLAADNSYATISGVLKNNITLLAGEVIDLLRCQARSAAGLGVLQ